MPTNVPNQTLSAYLHGDGNYRTFEEAAGEPPLVNGAAVDRQAALAAAPANPYTYTHPPAESRPLSGQNLRNGAYWEGIYPWIDLRYQSNQILGWTGTVSVNTKGNLTSNGGIADKYLILDCQTIYGGEYVLRWDTAQCADMSLAAAGAFGTFTLTENAPGRKVYDWAFPSGMSEADYNTCSLRVQANSPIVGALDDWHVILPGMEAAWLSGQRFNPHFVAECAKYDVIRFMDWLGTNDSDKSVPADLPDDTWDTWGEDGSQVHSHVPYTQCVNFAALAGANPWLCVPHLSDVTMMNAIAAEVRAADQALAPEDRPEFYYVEFSNEVWNGVFSQTAYAETQGLAEFPAISNSLTARGVWVAQRSIELKTAFTTAFGADADRIKLVVGGHLASGTVTAHWSTLTGDAFFDAARIRNDQNDIHNHVDFYAVAPYIAGQLNDSGYTSANNVAGWTNEQIANHLRTETGSSSLIVTAGWFEDQKEMLRAMDVFAPVVTYEGGTHLIPPSGLEQKYSDFNNSREGGDITNELNQVINDAGTRINCAFQLMGRHSATGFWGVLENIASPRTYRSLANDVMTAAVPGVDLVKGFAWGHSLFSHGLGTGSSEATTTHYWLGALAAANGVDSGWNGAFEHLWFSGVPPYPPQTNAMADVSTNTISADWPGGVYADANYTEFLFMVDNFESYFARNFDYPPLLNGAYSILTGSIGETPRPALRLYECWPDLPLAVGNGTTPANITPQQFATYWALSNGAWHDWHVNYLNRIHQDHPEYDLKMIPVTAVIADLFINEAYMSAVTASDIWLDDAPHGNETMYFLAALVCYRALYGRNPVYTVPGVINATVAANFTSIVSYIEGRLTYYNQNNVRVY